MDLKKTFFDTKTVIEKLPPAIRSALSKVGAFTRRRDKSSLKYGDKPAARGRPPTVHRSKGFTRTSKSKGKVKRQNASPLREQIFFGYDPDRQSVVTGPTPFRSEQESPGVLPAEIEEKHPHTLPAFRAELPTAADAFKGLIR